MNTTMSLPIPSALGSIEGYVQAVNRFPVLSHEEELSLATRFNEQNDLDAARQLVVSHLRVVVSVARGYAGYGLPQADLIQEGNVGLMKAVKRYDPATRRAPGIVRAALDTRRNSRIVIRNWRLVKIATTKAQRKLFFNLRSMKQGLEPLRPQQVSEIARQLNVSEHDVVDMEARFAGHEIALEPLAGEDEESYAPINYLADNAEHEPSHILEASEREASAHYRLGNALASLDERSRRIVEARWLREEENMPRRCMSWLPNSMCLPSASARLNKRR